MQGIEIIDVIKPPTGDIIIVTDDPDEDKGLKYA